jgi:exodeoxyribonuclease III
MRFATWNVNSIRSRVGRTVDWLLREDIDVLAMQEIKCKPEQFPTQAFEEAGYEVIAHGLNQWNGVAIASRLPITDVSTTFANQPGFLKGEDGPNLPLEARAVAVTVERVRYWSLYVPNGRALDDPHYAYKLEWLRALREDTADWLKANPDGLLALTGDWNIAPTDADMGDPSFVAGLSTHISEPERSTFESFIDLGLVDVVRPLVPSGYTFWDYQQLKFPRDEGMRIDFILGSPAFASLVTGAKIDREERKGDSPSDHVPVVVDVGLTAEDDELDRPMFL